MTAKKAKKKDGRGGRREGAGRPALDAPRKKHIAMRYPIALIERVDEAAKEDGVTRTAWIEDAIEKKLDGLDSSDP